jgi:hypothetical protein
VQGAPDKTSAKGKYGHDGILLNGCSDVHVCSPRTIRHRGFEEVSSLFRRMRSVKRRFRTSLLSGRRNRTAGSRGR